MRIEQPQHLRPIVIESTRRSSRDALKAARPRLTILALIVSALCLGKSALRAAAGESVSGWQWVGTIAIGPFFTEVLLPWAVWFRVWIDTRWDRYAEIRGGRVRLGKVGYTFRPGLLIWCKIEPDPYFPGIYTLGFCFKTFRSGRPLYWLMMVEDLDEAEAFRHELEGLAFEPP